MGESMITSFDGTKLYLKKETAADNKAVIVIVTVSVSIRAGMIILQRSFMRRELVPTVLTTEDMDALKERRLFIRISMNFWMTPM